MITDERTQNKLYADTETTLFRLENKPEAVSRIMEIIRDTPEYVQLMHSLPTYAEEDRQAAWWQGKESDSLLAELLHVLELYTPEGFIIKCALLDFVFSFTREEELEYYRQQHKTTIYYQIFDLFRRKPWTVTDNLMTVASEINIPTKEHPEGLDCDCPACQYVREAYRKLIENGYLEEYTQTRLREKTLCARATEKGISKNIFYGTQL